MFTFLQFAAPKLEDIPIRKATLLEKVKHNNYSKASYRQ